MMDEPFNWMYALIVLVSAGPSNLILAYAVAAVFPPKNARTYWMLQVLMLVFAVVAKPHWNVEFTMVVGTLSLVIVPLFCLTGSLLPKAVVIVVALVVQFSAEIPVAFVWIAVVGQPVMDNEAVAAHFIEYLSVVILLHIVLLAALFWMFVKVCRRFVMFGVSNRMFDQIKAFALFPCAQFVLLLAVMYVPFVSVGDDETYLVPVAFLFAVCFSVDVLLFIQMRRCADKRLSDLNAELLQEQADGYLATAVKMQQSLAEAAVLRHDLRNHLQVVEGLCERGDRQAAQAYLAEAAEQLS